MLIIVCIFIDYVVVEVVCEVVLNIGFILECVLLLYQGDEVGVLCGNFFCGDYELGGENVEIYECKFWNVVIGGCFLLIIDVELIQVDVVEVVLWFVGGYVVDDFGLKF